MLNRIFVSIVPFLIIGLSPAWGQSLFINTCKDSSRIEAEKQLIDQFSWLKSFFKTNDCKTLAQKIKSLKSFSEFIPFDRPRSFNDTQVHFIPSELKQPFLDYDTYNESWKSYENSFIDLRIFKEFTNLKHYNYGAYSESKQNICQILQKVPSLKSLTIFHSDLSEKNVKCISQNNLKIFIQNNFTPSPISDGYIKNIFGIRNYTGNIEELYKYTNLFYLGLEDYSGQSNLKVLTQLRNISNLHINIRNLSSPEDISYLESLKYLTINCYETRFEKVPRTLQERKCKGNALKDIRFLENLYLLEGLDVSWNEIKDLEPIKNIQSLKYLIARHNKIKAVPDLKSLTHLKYLDLAANNIRSVTGLVSASNIKFLNIGGNEISEIKELSNLKHLTHLSIGNNPIVDFDQFIPTNSLKFLNLNANAPFNFNTHSQKNTSDALFTILKKDTIESWWAEQLFYSGMNKYFLEAPKSNSNTIQHISLSKFKKLEALSISGHALSELKFLSPLKRLKYIDLSNNQTLIPFEMNNLPPNLEYANFRGSLKIEKLNLGRLKKILFLGLGQNEINLSSIESLESESLINLSLDGCKLKSLPVIQLPRLKVLDLKKNELNSIENLKLPDLEFINLENNKITNFPDFTQYKKLVNIKLKENKISTIENMAVLKQAKHYIAIDLSYNKIRDLSIFSKLNLQFVSPDLYANPIDRTDDLTCPKITTNTEINFFCEQRL